MGLFGFLKKDKAEPSLPKLPSEAKGDATPSSLPPLDDASLPNSPSSSLPPLDAPSSGAASLPPIGDVSSTSQSPSTDLPPLDDAPLPAPAQGPSEPLAQSQEVVQGASEEFKLPDFSADEVAAAQELSKKKSAASLLDQPASQPAATGQDFTAPVDESPKVAPVQESLADPQPAAEQDDLPPAPGPQEREPAPLQESSVQEPVPVQDPVVDPVSSPEPSLVQSPQAPAISEEPSVEPQLQQAGLSQQDFAAAVDGQPSSEESSVEPLEMKQENVHLHIHDGGIFVEKGVYGGALLSVAAIEKQVKSAASHVQRVVDDEVAVTDKLKKWHDVLGEIEEKLMFIDEKLFEKGEM